MLSKFTDCERSVNLVQIIVAAKLSSSREDQSEKGRVLIKHRRAENQEESLRSFTSPASPSLHSCLNPPLILAHLENVPPMCAEKVHFYKESFI